LAAGSAYAVFFLPKQSVDLPEPSPRPRQAVRMPAPSAPAGRFSPLFNQKTPWREFKSDDYDLTFSHPSSMTLRADEEISGSWSLFEFDRRLVDLTVTGMDLETAKQRFPNQTFVKYPHPSLAALKTSILDENKIPIRSLYLLERSDGTTIWVVAYLENFRTPPAQSNRLLDRLVDSLGGNQQG
jgi:hypothetical protein